MKNGSQLLSFEYPDELAGILHLSYQRVLYFVDFTLLPKLETAIID